MHAARVLSALLIVGGVGWLLGGWPDYRPSSLNLWLVLSAAVAVLALVNAWRSVVPGGSSRGPGVLLVLACAGAAVALWDVADWVPATAVLVALALGVGLGLSAVAPVGCGRASLVALVWVPRARVWTGSLPAVTRAVVALSSARLTLAAVDLAGETDLNVTVLIGRLEVTVPADLLVVPHPTAGLGLRLEGEAVPGVGGPPLNLRVLGLAGVVEVRREAASPPLT